MISINDLMLSVRRLQKLPDDTKLQRVVDVLTALDEDKDGAINVDLALKVCADVALFICRPAECCLFSS